MIRSPVEVALILAIFGKLLKPTASLEESLPPSFKLERSNAELEFDLLGALKSGFQESKTLYIETGHDGFPAFGFKSGSSVKSPYRLFLPEKLPREFSLLIRAKPSSPHKGGYLFAVVNPLESVVQLGVKLTPVGANTIITLLYTNPNQYESQKLAEFTVKFSNGWTSFAFRVTSDNVTLFFNCEENNSVQVLRVPQELVFDSASTLYLGQAGSLLKDPYEGALDQLKLFDDPNMAAVQCDTGFQGFQSGDDPLPGNSIEDGNRDGDWEGSGLFPFPPPPPSPDGKNCDCGGNADCCNYLFKDLQTSSRPKGEKGDRGPRGPSGESIRGPPGPPGPPGLPGIPYEGPAASCTCNLTNIMESFAMPKMMAGPPGVAGAEGKSGPPGIPGLPGPAGERGAVGPLGERGERGEQGLRGPEGMQGVKGEAGRDGIPGLPGPPGPAGPPGPVEFGNSDDVVIGAALQKNAPPAIKGDAGPEGPAGPRGERGPGGGKGDKGDLGSKGEQGTRGYTGDKGPQGPKGEPGKSGLDGLPGIPGANGKNAEKGEKGEPGKIGTPGPAGPPGVPIYATQGGEMIGAVPGTPGSKGDSGEQGSKGEKGDRGENGIGGIPGANGAPGNSGEKGEPGEDGLSGAAGPHGTKGEKGERGPPGLVTFANVTAPSAIVRGDKGEMGKRGRRGKPGPAGPVGPPGKPGPAGEIGVPGWMNGIKGRPGPPGLPGVPGTKGDKGSYATVKGEKGDRGMDGIPGKDAEPTDKYVTIPGPPGPPGPPGAPGLSITGPKGEAGATNYGEPTFNLRPGGRSSLEELKALRELKELKFAGRATASPPIHFPAEHQQTRIVPGAISFQNRDLMLKMTFDNAVGTMAFIIDEEAVLVRVNRGWQYIALGSLLPAPAPVTTTTPTPVFRPPFEASNLINRISQNEAVAAASHLRLVALNEPYTGDIHGIRGADYACYREARRAGLRGTFRAFISSRAQNVDSIVRFADRKLPISNIRGEVLFNSWTELFRGDEAPFTHTRILSFNGKNVLTDPSYPHKLIWHGSLTNGERVLDLSCDAWHSKSKEKVGLASSLDKQKLLEQNSYPCNKRLILLCIEATSEQFVQRRRRDLNVSRDEILSEAEYQVFLSTSL